MRQPYPVRPLRKFPRSIRFVEIGLWLIVFGILLVRGFSLWPIVAGFCVEGLLWILIDNRMSCEECGRCLESRTEMDDLDYDHLFYDCHACRMTFDPEYATGSDPEHTYEDR